MIYLLPTDQGCDHIQCRQQQCGVGGDSMMTASWMLLLLLTLHLPSHHTKNLLLNVDTDDKDSRVSSNSNKALYGPPNNPG